MGGQICKVFGLYGKEESEIENEKIIKEEKIKVTQISISMNSDENGIDDMFITEYLNYIDILEILIFLFNNKIIFFKYPSMTRISEYENIINTMPISYINYQKNSNKLYLNYENKDFTNIYLIQNNSIKLLEEIIPLKIKDLIEISTIKIIVLDNTNEFCSCFELKNKKYQKIKTFEEDENGNENEDYNEIYSIRKCPNTNKFFILTKKFIQVFDSQNLELINNIYIENDDICFINYHYFIIVKSYYKKGYSRLSLVDLKTFKILNHTCSGYDKKKICRLQNIGNTRYFIASEWTNVSIPLIMELDKNKIYYVKDLANYNVNFETSLYFNNTIVIGGEEQISIFKLDIK